MGELSNPIVSLEEARRVLKQYWGYDSFRPAQEKIIRNIIEKEKAIGIVPTGGGKSLGFQIPAMLFSGVCLVVSPLIALIDDQVQNLIDKGISAIALHSKLTKAQYFLEVDNIINGKYKFVYVSPEKLVSEHFRSVLSSFNIHLMAVDEAHCISMWGFDFRPAYKKLNEIVADNPNWRICALTASATKRVLSDIKEQLHLQDAPVTKVSLQRNNLRYAVLKSENTSTKLLELVKKIQGSGLIYTRSRMETKELAALLDEEGIDADFYHAGLDMEERTLKQEMWMKNEIRVMVCTNAFGMGIDKSDVRFVFHSAPPENLAYYYQEAGRAGRDGELSYVGLLYNAQTLHRLEDNYKNASVPLEFLKEFYGSLHSYYNIALGSGMGETFPFDYKRVHEILGIKPQRLLKALNIFQMHGILQLSENYHKQSSVFFKVSSDDTSLANLPESLTNIITVLQRKYAGIYNHMVEIDEKFIAKEVLMPKSALRQYLERLRDLEIIEYESNNQNHFIQFLQDRQRMFLGSYDTIEIYGQMQKFGFESMSSYLTEGEVCRNQIISAYFGMKTELPCGTCDNCKRSKSSQGFKNAFKEKANYLRKEMASAKSRKEILEKVKSNHYAALVLQELLERKVAVFKNNKWHWHAK